MTLIANAKTIARKIQWRLSRRQRVVRSLDELTGEVAGLLVTDSHELSQTQVYPFHAYASELEGAIGGRLCEIDLECVAAQAAHPPLPGVRWVGFQAVLNCPVDVLLGQVQQLKRLFPNAALVYFDWYAPLDLRHAPVLDPWVTHYVKKQTFSDLRRYADMTVGDTNLMDYYSRRYGLQPPTTQHEFPLGFERKLTIGTNFCVSPHMLDRFMTRPPERDRHHDVHARIAVRGTDWYQRMRQEALDLARSVKGVRTVSEGRVSQRQFFDELARSKICFSPFGYGEVCWRDFEAVFSGALLLKPRMDHVCMEPNIFVDGQTYVALEWDGSDYEEKVRHYLAHEPERLRIVEQAYDVVQRYLRERPFIARYLRLLGHAT